MKKTMVLLILLTLLSLPSIAQEEPFKPHWAIGLQGNAELWSGLSFRYVGWDPIYIQLTEVYFKGNDFEDFMMGLGIPVLIFKGKWTQFYVAPTGGVKWSKDTNDVSFPPKDLSPNRILSEETVKKFFWGGGLLFGVETILKERYGFNIEFGQILGRLNTQTECTTLNPNGDGPCQKMLEEFTKTKATLTIGGGFHVFF